MSFRTLSTQALFRIGSASLAISILTPRLLHPATVSAENWIDGVRGLTLGVSLALFFIVLRRGGFRQSRCRATG